MNQVQIKKLIDAGEGISVEFKECRDKLGTTVYESICAFLIGRADELGSGVRKLFKTSKEKK